MSRRNTELRMPLESMASAVPRWPTRVPDGCQLCLHSPALVSTPRPTPLREQNAPGCKPYGCMECKRRTGWWPRQRRRAAHGFRSIHCRVSAPRRDAKPERPPPPRCVPVAGPHASARAFAAASILPSARRCDASPRAFRGLSPRTPRARRNATGTCRRRAYPQTMEDADVTWDMELAEEPTHAVLSHGGKTT